MSVHKESWPEGTPAWVDLMVPDRHAARAFYGPLFGWEFDEGSAESGYYTNCTKDGEAVAGLGEMAADALGHPPAWTTYIAVGNVDDAIRRVTEAAGALLMGPVTVGASGRMAVASDPTGAVFGLWQSGQHTGSNRVNEPGCVVWNEVMTRDFRGAQQFYASVFGYSFGDMSGDGFTYATLDLAGRPVGGVGEMGADMPAEAPAHWATCFAVADTDGTVSHATALGAGVLLAPMDTPFGRLATLRGPLGEVFSVMGPNVEGTSTGQTSTGQTSTGQTSTGQTSTGQTSTGQTSTGQTEQH